MLMMKKTGLSYLDDVARQAGRLDQPAFTPGTTHCSRGAVLLKHRAEHQPIYLRRGPKICLNVFAAWANVYACTFI
jgi:hypothetical protein